MSTTTHHSVKYSEQFPDMRYRTWFGAWRASEIGFGTYRVSDGNKVHKQALRQALTSGINVIDTSTNYADGNSEILIGKVLRELEQERKIHREDVILISKIGYVQGKNYEEAVAREQNNAAFPEMVKYGKNLWHCISPEFLEHQLTALLERLQTSSINILLLHNPEYFLSHAANMHVDLHDARAEYYRRIEQAFRYLESEVERGRIEYYGISSNTFPESSENADFTSLEECWNIAENLSMEYGGQHHFGVVQLPMNLMENTAAWRYNQEDNTKTVLQFASERELVVLINRPLNGIRNEVLYRLADAPQQSETVNEFEIASQISNLVRHEGEFYVIHLSNLPVPDQEGALLRELLAPGALLQRYWKTFNSFAQWQSTRNEYILPRARFALERIAQFSTDAALRRWIEEFSALLEKALRAVTHYYIRDAQEKNVQLRQDIGMSLGREFMMMPLSHASVNALRATNGISCILVGMRSPDYVSDIARVFSEDFSTLGREQWLELYRRL